MMAVEGIGSLVQILANQLRERTLNGQTEANRPAIVNTGSVAIGEDTFTPSTQNSSAHASAQAAGIFHVNPCTFANVTANMRLAQPPSYATKIEVPPQDALNAAANIENAQQQAPATNPTTHQYPGQVIAAGHPVQTPARQPVQTPLQMTSQAVQIQALNAALPALGLSKVEIQEIDSIAMQIQNFSPATYANLVNQFEALAQQ